MPNGVYLSNHFLIAMPSMTDPNFFQSVTLICEHNEEGAMGIVVNRPANMDLSDILNHMKVAYDSTIACNIPIVMGGPVQPERGFVIHQTDSRWESSRVLSDDISVTSSRDVLLAIAHGQGPKKSLIALGYAGWGAGQLELEIKQNSWLASSASSEVLFESPMENRWAKAAQLLGIDLDTLTNYAGHA